MSQKLKLMGLIRLAGCGLPLSISLSACGNHSEKWQEDVPLVDGRVLVVERETIFQRGGDELVNNSSGIKPKYRKIDFSMPEAPETRIEWKSTKVDFQNWPESPLLLEIEAGHPVVFSISAISIFCEIYSKYVYKDGKWLEEKLPENFSFFNTNLLIRDGVHMPKYVNLTEKIKINSDSRYRESLKRVGPTKRVCSS